jgi:hypothetical protein
MSFTDLWRCRGCNVLPDVQVRGKNFLIKCKNCNSRRSEAFANSLDEVVALWNKKNSPIKTPWFAGLRELPSVIKDFLEYQMDRLLFDPTPLAQPHNSGSQAEHQKVDSAEPRTNAKSADAG